MNTQQDNVFVCDLSREQIRENRRLKRQRKKEAQKKEKQAQRDMKIFLETINKNRSEKLKIVNEQEMVKYRLNESDNRTDRTSVRQAFPAGEEFFPNLPASRDVKSLETKCKAEKSTSNTTVTYAKLIAKTEPKAVILLDQKTFPNLNQAGSGESRKETVFTDSSNQVEITSQNQSTNVINVTIDENIVMNEKLESDLNLTNINENSLKTPVTCEKNTLVDPRNKISKICKRSLQPYRINLLQSTKVSLTQKNRNRLVDKRKNNQSLTQTEGNTLDSTKPIKINRGKHYLRNEVFRRNKKQMTKTKRIICNYRKVKNDNSFTKSLDLNMFLTREFLISLNQQIKCNSSSSSNFEKQILLFNEFTNKRNKNKLWKNMRECLQSAAEKTKHVSVEIKKDCSENETTVDKIEQDIKHIENEEIENIQGTCEFWNTESFEINNEPSKPEDDSCQVIIADPADHKTDHVKPIRNIRHEINETPAQSKNMKTNSEDTNNLNEKTDKNATNARKQKRLEKKQRKNHVIALDETIVATKAKLDVNDEENKLDLNKAVNSVVVREDLDNVCRVKQQMHSRTFRPYCNQMPSSSLRQASVDLVKQIVQFQERLYKADPLKGRTKRRYIVGIKEVMKNLPVRNRVKLLFIAPDIESVPVPGSIDDEIQSLLTMSTIQGVTYLFSLPRRVLGSLTYKRPTSCLAVLDYSGCEVLFDRILSLISEAREAYDGHFLKLSTSIEPTVPDQNSKPEEEESQEPLGDRTPKVAIGSLQKTDAFVDEKS